MEKIKTIKKLLGFIGLTAGLLGLSGCQFSLEGFGGAWNVLVTVLAITAGVVLLFFIVLGVASTFYKGKDVTVKVIQKKESKVLQGSTMGKTSAGYRAAGTMSRKQRRQKGRIRFSKVTVELEGKEKTLKGNDMVLPDKLAVGRNNKIRIRFGEIVKILK